MFDKIKKLALTEKEIKASLNKKHWELYQEEIFDVHTVLKNTQYYCQKVALLTCLLIIIQLEIFSQVTTVYLYITMPIHIKILTFLSYFLHLWGPILIMLFFAKLYICIKRPTVWEKFLIQAPLVRKITIPLYYFRYFWTKSFTNNEQLSLSAVNNETFSLTPTAEDTDPMAMEIIKDEYPLLYTFAKLSKKDKADITCNDYATFARYIKKVFVEACFDFRKLFSYFCIEALIIITILTTIVIFNQ